MNVNIHLDEPYPHDETSCLFSFPWIVQYRLVRIERRPGKENSFVVDALQLATNDLHENCGYVICPTCQAWIFEVIIEEDPL